MCADDFTVTYFIHWLEPIPSNILNIKWHEQNNIYLYLIHFSYISRFRNFQRERINGETAYCFTHPLWLPWIYRKCGQAASENWLKNLQKHCDRLRIAESNQLKALSQCKASHWNYLSMEAWYCRGRKLKNSKKRSLKQSTRSTSLLFLSANLLQPVDGRSFNKFIKDCRKTGDSRIRGKGEMMKRNSREHLARSCFIIVNGWSHWAGWRRRQSLDIQELIHDNDNTSQQAISDK